MKKILITFSLTILCLINLSNLTLAVGLNVKCSDAPNEQCDQGFTCQQVDYKQYLCKNTLDVLTQRTNYNNNKDISNVQKLPEVNLEGGLTLAIKAMLRSAMYLTIIAIVVAAMYYIISRGKDEDMTKAKDIILYLVIGMVIIAAAYGIVAGITQFNVFG